MARDPHTDLQAQALETSLRESNVSMADTALEHADWHLDAAMKALEHVPTPTDVVSRAIYAQAHAAVAAAMYGQVNAKMTLEYERAQVSHQRAHLDHATSEQERDKRIDKIRVEGLQHLAERLREAGFDPQVMGNLGLVIPPNDDDGPNT